MSKYILSFLLICISFSMNAQLTAQEKLEQRKAEIQAQIKANEKLLQNVKKQIGRAHV